MNAYMERILQFFYRRIFDRNLKDISQKDFSRDLFLSEEKKIVLWPNDSVVALNLQFDDFCTQSKKNSRYDYGGNPHQGVVPLFTRFLEAHEAIKTTLFFVPWGSFNNSKGIFIGERKNKEVYAINNPSHKNLVDWIHTHNDRVEIACHGFNHIQTHKKHFLTSAEFEFSSSQEAEEKISQGLRMFEEVEIPIFGFRPPMWGIGYNAGFGLINALKKLPFSYIAGSSPLSGLNWDRKRVSNIYPQYYEGILNIPQNISLAWNIEKIKDAIDAVISYGGIITLMGHFNEQDNWMEDGIGEKNLEKIDKIISYVRVKCHDKVWFATLSEIASFWKKEYPA